MPDEEVKKDPMEALQYYAGKLTKEQLDYCRRYSTYTALKYWEDALTKEQLDYCVNERNK